MLYPTPLATSLVTGGTCKSHQFCTSDTLSTKRPLCWICHPKTMLYNLLNKLRYSTSCGHSAVGIHTYLWYSCLILCVVSSYSINCAVQLYQIIIVAVVQFVSCTKMSKKHP